MRKRIERKKVDNNIKHTLLSVALEDLIEPSKNLSSSAKADVDEEADATFEGLGSLLLLLIVVLRVVLFF